MVYVPHLHNYMTREQFEELKKEINKPEYKKILEPVEKELGNEIWKLRKKNQAYQQLVFELIDSIEDNSIPFYVNNTTIEAKWITPEELNKIDEVELTKFNIPIKENIKKSIIKRYYELLGNDEI